MSTAKDTHKNGIGAEGRTRPWSARYPHLGTGPLPTEVFTSREQFELEREHIFKKVWLNVGRVELIPEVGDYFVKDIAMCQTSILVVRGNDGEIRAFHNMCTHRGNKVAWEPIGNCKVFTCKFHAWAFELDGALRHVPDEENFFDLKRGEMGLSRVPCDVWEGFVFINVDPNPEESLDEYLGDWARGLRGYPFAEVSATSSEWTTEISANWKLAKDAFQENYHIKSIHRRTGAGALTSADNPYAHFLDVKLFPRHGQASVAGYPPKQRSPSKKRRPTVRALAGQLGALPFSSGNQDSDEVGGLPPGVNPLGFHNWVTDLNIIFPSFLIITTAGSIVTHNFWPLDVDRTLWQMTQYFPKAQTFGERFSQECGHVLVRDVAMEDGSTLEQTQSMLASGARRDLFLKDEEILIRHGHNVVDQMIKGQPLHTPGVQEEGAGV